MSAPETVLRLNPADDVAVALIDLAPGARLQGVGAVALDPVAAGHKVAVRAVPTGAVVRKYGQAIGVAKRPIKPGQHVHVHNLAVGALDRAAEIGSELRNVEPRTGATFEGFVRADGRVGTRNYVGVLTSVNCSATVARRVADGFRDGDLPTRVDGVAAFTHGTGCGTAKSGEGPDNLRRTLAGYARHANLGGALIVGLGCEVAQIPALLDEFELEPGDRLQTLTIQDAGGTVAAIARGGAIARELAQQAARDRRETVSAAHLTVGLQCGGSDGWSGVTANPALGAAVDRLVAAGGTAILSETPEIYGAEHLLLRRAATGAVAEALMERLAWWEAYAARHGAKLNNNPSPGNLKGGLTTILEKSLGAVAKSGSTPLNAVYRYAEPIAARGLVFMDSPGYDPCSATGQIASGANLIAFTTGRGSVFGSKPAPCLKLASNADLARRMDDDIDVDCSGVLDGQSIDDLGELIFARLLAVASGEPTRSEALGFGDHEFVPWQIGAWM